MCSLVESSPLTSTITGAGPSSVGRRLAEVGRQRRALVGDRDPGRRRGLCRSNAFCASSSTRR